MKVFVMYLTNLFRFDGIDANLHVDYILNADKNFNIYADMLELHSKKSILELIRTREVHICTPTLSFKLLFSSCILTKLLKFRRVPLLSMLGLWVW